MNKFLKDNRSNRNDNSINIEQLKSMIMIEQNEMNIQNVFNVRIPHLWNGRKVACVYELAYYHDY